MDYTSFTQYINTIKSQTPEISYDDFIKNFDDLKLNIKHKENDTGTLVMFYNNTFTRSKQSPIEQSCRCTIVEKNTLHIISAQYNNLLYDDDIIRELKHENIKWDNVEIQKSYEGTTILVFNYNDQWYTTTRRCFDANLSKWSSKKTHLEMFHNAIKDKFTYDDLNKNYYYTFILLNHNDSSIINYSSDDEYTNVIQIQTQKKYTHEYVEHDLDVQKSVTVLFKDLDTLLEYIKIDNEYFRQHNKINYEGYIIKYKKDDSIIHGKIQYDQYKQLTELKNNNQNIDQIYLELYQKDKLREFLPYFTKYTKNITNRISSSMKTLAKEILNIYHQTRNKKNPVLYNNISKCYKQHLYNIHGLYIKKNKQNTEHNLEEQKDNSISIHDVYHYLKNLYPGALRNVFKSHYEMVQNKELVEYLNGDCTSLILQNSLMFEFDYKDKDQVQEQTQE